MVFFSWKSYRPQTSPDELVNCCQIEIYTISHSVYTSVSQIYVNSEAQPRYHRARSVPYMLREKIEAELDRLQRENIIYPVEHSEWACPIVPIIKTDGESVQICGDTQYTK